MQLKEPSFRGKTYQGYTAKKVGLELSIVLLGFPGSTVVKNQPANAEDTRDASSVPGSGRSPGVGNSTPLQYSCLESSMDRGAQQATVHGVGKSGI